MIEEQFRTHLLRNNKTDILVSLNKRGLDSARTIQARIYC